MRQDPYQPRYGGSTAFGTAVVKECNRLGMLIDLAPANVLTTEAALKVTTKPVTISHTSFAVSLYAVSMVVTGFSFLLLRLAIHRNLPLRTS